MSKLDREVILKINEVVALANIINFQTDYCMFYKLSGHVDLLEVSIRKSKNSYHSIVANAEVNLEITGYRNKESVINRLNEVIETLEQFLKQEKIPYDFMYKEQRIEYDWKF